MSEKQASAPTGRISSFVLIVVFFTLALSFAAVIFGASILEQNAEAASMLLLIGFFGMAISTYVMFQRRRRLSKLKIVMPPVTTTIECKKCGFKNVREFQRGDYIFKEGEACQKCNEKMLVTAIYREVKEKDRPKAAV